MSDLLKVKSFGFGLRAFKNFPELLPLCVIIGVACTGCAAFMGYALATKPDVRLDKRQKLPPWERVGPTDNRKMITLNQKYAPIPELEKLRKEIGSYKY